MNPLDWLLNKKKVVDNSARIEQEMKPLIQKANARNVQKYKSGQINREQYQQQSDAVLKRQYNQPQNKARSSGAQALFPLMGSAGGLISRVPGNVATLAGNAIQDPLGSAVRGIEAINPVNYSIKAFNAVSPKDIPNPFQWREDKLANGASNATKSITPQSVQNVQGSVGRGLERIGKTSDETITGILSNSELDPNARPGENRLVTNLSSGAGSLAASVGLSRLPGGTMLPSTVFGINSAGQQTRQARDAGKSNSEALNIGVQAGAAEAGLEKAGLDEFLGNFGNKSSIVNTLKNALVEGGQESAQSLAGSAIGSQYQNVDWSNAGMQALQEGGLGALLGGGSTAIAGGIQGATNRPQIPLTPELQSKRNALEIQASNYANSGRPDLAERLGAQIQEIDNPTPGTLREQIRNAKNTVVNTYQDTKQPDLNPSDNELFTLTDFGDLQMGENKQEADGIPRNNLTKLARQIGDKYGVDVLTGSPQEIQSRITDFVEAQRALRGDEAGFINADPNDSEVVRLAKTAKKLATGKGSKAKLEVEANANEIANVNPSQLPQQNQRTTKNAGLSVKEVQQGKQLSVESPSDTNPLESLKQEARKYGAEIEFANRKPTKKEGVHGKYRDGKIVVFTKGVDGKPRSQADIEKTLSHEIGHAFDYKRRGIVADPMGDSIRDFEGNLRPSRDSDIYFRDNRLQEAQNIRQLAPRADGAANTQKEVYADAYRLYRTQPKDLEQAAPRIYKELDDYFNSDPTPTAKEFSEATQSQPPKSPVKTDNPFKDSKIQEPIYHGTKSDFKQFDNKMMGSQTDSGMFGKGFYFTPNEKSARHYAGKDGKIKEVYLDMKNPYVINSQADIPDIKVDGYNTEEYSEKFTQYLKDRGYDGVIDNVGLADNQRIVFDASQIKIKESPLTVEKTPFTPLSQPVDNIPAVAKQVTNGSTSTKQNQSEIQPTSQAVLPNPKTSKQNKVQGSNQSKVRSQTIDSTDSVSSSQENPLNNMGILPPTVKKIKDDRTPIQQAADEVREKGGTLSGNRDEISNRAMEIAEEREVEALGQDPARPAEEFGAVAANPKSKKTRVLVDAIKADMKLTEASRAAQMEGSELNYYAKKDDSGRSVGIEQFDPKNHRIEAGFVVDNNGKVLGNHIKVDDTGIQVNVGGEIVNVETIIGNPQDWDGNYRMMETMDRNIQRLAPDEATYRKTRRFTVDHKIKSEANFRTELKAQRQQLAERAKPVMKARPRGVSKKEYNADIFDFIEGNKTKAEITSKYGKVVSEKISTYQKETRKMYDDILERVNETFVKFGEAPVPKRKDYLTHINELNSKPSFAGEIYGQLQNSILGEGMNTTRSGVPADIAGRTENFQPRKRWNKFFQARTGGEFSKDPFKAVDAYLEPSLYNIHMTESAVRARAVESAFRTAEVIRKTDAKAVTEEFGKTIEKYGKADNSNLVTGFQEWANALSGKTQRTDRQLIDSSKGSAFGLRSWQGLQRIGGRGTILGNVQSVLSQALNQPLTLADAGPINYVKGIATSLSGGTPIDQSSFITARSTNAESDYKSRGGKILDAGGVPLQAVELAMVKLTWNSQYHKAVADGYKGNEAVMEADRRTEQVVAGRGIADKPEAYRSTAYNGLLQYTLEVSASNKKFFQDLNTTQKAEFLVATMAMNSLMGLVTGTEPLPDLLGSIFDTAGDLLDDEDERSTQQKIGGGAKDLLGESVSMNPLLTAGANTFLSQDQRKAFFGDNSSIGRFEGTAAPVQVVRNAAGAVTSAAQGKWTDARNKTLKNLPFGNQAQKTIRGAEALRDGYAVDSSGNPTYSVASDPLNATKSLLFGPNAAREARGYYDKNQTSVTGEKDKKAIEGSSNKSETVAQIQQRRLDNREDKDGNTTASTSQGNSRDELIKRLDESDDTLTDTEKTLAKFYKDLPKGLSEESISELAKYERLNPNSKKRLYKGVNAQIKLKTAELERDTITGVLNTAQEFEAKKDIAKLELAKPYGENVVDMYGLSLYEIESIADQATYDKLVAYDKDLFLNDLISKPKFKVNNSYTSKGGRRGGGSGGKAKIDQSAYNSTKNQLDTFKRLDALLAGTRKPVTGGTKKVATRKPVLKQIKVRA